MTGVYNRYQGNTGRVQRVDDRAVSIPVRQPHAEAGQSPAPPQSRSRTEPQRGGSQPGQGQQTQGAGANTQRPAPRPVSAPGPGAQRPAGPLSGLSGELGRLLGRLSPMNLETDDLILAMILYLMYRESHDEELLYIMAAMFLL